ncbi:unnamed protein product, partial [Ectocarpus sp. 12 AP-2014]
AAGGAGVLAEPSGDLVPQPYAVGDPPHVQARLRVGRPPRQAPLLVLGKPGAGEARLRRRARAQQVRRLQRRGPRQEVRDGLPAPGHRQAPRQAQRRVRLRGEKPPPHAHGGGPAGEPVLRRNRGPRRRRRRRAAANKNGVGGVRNDTHAEGARMLNATLPTVLKHFPGALEAVIVVPNADAWREYQLVVGVHNNSDTPFDIKVVNVGEDDASSDWVSKDRTGSGLGEEALRRKAIGRRRGSEAEEQPFPLLWADTYCSGKFVLHLDLNSVLLERITYDHMFHFEKPVIPFNRFQDKETWQTRAHPGNACWRHRARAFLDLPAGENVVHGFAGYDAHVYPVDLYPTLRDHLRAPTEGSMELMEAMKQGECTFGKSYLFRPSMMRRKAENPEKQRLFRREMQYNLMATFLWYRMHDSIHWSAIDPLDLTPDEWMTDPDKYRSWSCNLGAGRGLPAMPAAAAEMLRE